MSSCMDRLGQIVGLAKSKKVTDYKKGIKQLLEFWDDDSEVALRQITDHSKNPENRCNAYTWNELFNIVHELFKAEIERISRLSGNSGSLDKDRIIKLMYATTERANSYLKPKDVVFSTLQVLQIEVSHIYSEYYEMYLDILRKYVLQERSQRILVVYSHWSELLKACVLLLENVIPKVNYYKVLEIIELIIQYGSSSSNLLYDTKKLLPLIEKLLDNFETYNIKSTEILFKVTYTICHQIVVDSRFMLCRFAEQIPLSLINLKGPEEKYDMYLLFLQVHHPNGAILDDEDFYAFDCEKWKAILGLLFKMILNDIKPVKLSKSFINLSSEVFRQQIRTNLPSLSETSSFHESLYIQPKKKRRIDEKGKIIDLVNDRDPMRAWPMIQIVTVLYEKYPDCLQFDEYIEFIQVTTKLMNQACKNFYIMENLCELATVLVRNEKRYREEDLKIYWDKVFDAVLRFVSMSHDDTVEKGCILVQNLISHKKVSDPCSLLKLYLTKSIQWSNYSIQTLRVFCENFIIPSNIGSGDINSMHLTDNSVKFQLLQLTINSLTRRTATSLQLEKFSKILIGFTLKSWYKCENSTFQNRTYNRIDLNNNFYDNLKSITTEDIERCYLSLKLKLDFTFDQSETCNAQMVKNENVDNPYVPEDLDFLINSLIQMMQTNDTAKDLSLFIIKTALIAQIITDLKAMNMIQCHFDEFCLVCELKVCLRKIFNQISSINWSKSIRCSLEITKALIVLFQTKYDILVNDIILSFISLPLLKKIHDILKLKSDEFEEDNKISNCIINAVIVLALYCSVDSGVEVTDMQIKIISTLLKAQKYSLSDKTDAICITTILDIFANFPSSMASEEFIELLMTFIMELFEDWQKDDRFNCCLLKVLPKILDKTVCINDQNHTHNILLICKLFHDRFVKGAFGQISNLTLVQCLNKIVQHKIFSSTDNEVLKEELFIDFIKSPYYFVRLESLKYLYSIFSMNHISCKWKSDFFDKLKIAVHKLFLMQNLLSENEIQEEKLLRSVSAVQILATVICSKSVFQTPALLSLLDTAVSKGIDENIVKKVLNVINKTNTSSNSIIEENLNYLLTFWCQENSLDTFPFALLDCHGDADFYARHLQIIYPILIRESKMEDAISLCNKLNVSFKQTFISCCSNIIPWALIKKEELLTQLKDNSGIFRGLGSLTLLIKDNLQQIVIQSVQRLHDLDNFFKIFDTTIDLPASNPPHFKSNEVDQCFERLMKIICSSESHQSVLYFIITQRPSVLQKVLLQLTRNIYTSQLSENKAKAFHQYSYLCLKITQELSESYCDTTATYFIYDIGCTLLNLARQNDKFITRLSCRFLYIILKTVLPHRSKQVGNILSLCVKTLVPLVHDPKKNSPAKDVLVLLLIENKERLYEAIKNLSSLPSFVKSKDDLDAESEFLRINVQHFLNTSDDKNCNIDSLLNLKRQLVTKRAQLERMHEELESLQGFAEHCASSPLHCLIYRLIRLSESDDSKIALEAAKCLGVLGPADLSTMILHPQESQCRESFDKADTLTRKVCELLTELVVSSDIKVRAASSDALYIVFESPWGVRLISDMELDNADNFDFSLKDFLYPFRTLQKSGTSSNLASFRIDVEEFERTFDPENPLWSEASSSGCYNSWLASITSAVAKCLSGFYTTSLIPLFQLNVQLCEATLPRLIGLIVDAYPNLSIKICHCVNRLFNHHFDVDVVEQMYLNVTQVRLDKSRDAIRCMLDVVNHLRIQSNEQVHLDLDYLPIAMAAQFSSAYFSSVLYTELWCRSNLKIARDFDSIPIIDQVYEQDNKLGKIAQDILKEAYIKIGDTDSIYGCGSSHLQNRRSRISYYANFQKQDKLLLSHDVELSIGNLPIRGMINSLKDSNLFYLAKVVSNVKTMEVDYLEEESYEAFWRLANWNQVTGFRTPQSSKKIHNYSTYHYEALKSLHENDRSTLKECVEQAHFCIIKELSNISLESCKAVYPKLCQLQMLREIEEFSTANPNNVETLLDNWEKQKYIYNNDFQYVEPILAQRAVMFKMQECDQPIVKNALINTQLNVARLAQQQGHLNVAARALETLLKQRDLDEEAEDRLLYHEARLAWIRKDEDLARFNLRSIINKSSTKPSLLAHALRVYGNWIAENKSENPQAIINKYYQKAIATYISMPELSQDDASDGCKARAALAQFAHEQYLTINDYLKSPQFESFKECIDYSRNVVSKNVKITDQDVARAFKLSSRQSSNDCIEMANIQKDRSMYLSLAVSNYLGTLQDSDEHDLLIFRLVSLWLDNIYDEELNKLFDRHLLQVPSYKFIPLVPQLAPHMSNAPDVFSKKIMLVLERCAKDHPHHTLPVLLALKNLCNDSKYCEKRVTSQEPRVLGAQQLIQGLVSTNIRPIIQEMDKLSDALVQLAYFDSDKKNKALLANCPIPRKLILHEVRNFQYSMIFTLPVDVQKNGNYSDVTSVCKYEETYSNVGGINAPKKIICIGSDGIKRPQLVKGKDDLRQDAVMQQVFTVMNSLLKINKGTKHRKLYVRTYKVVPLTQRSGVLQWCENTLPLSSILTGDGSSTRQLGFHRKYYPNDLAPNDCRMRLKSVKDPTLRYNVFIDCCKNLRPAFQHFFTENYLSPETWFERRLAYTRSVATTSIIGYILGLGDRHVSNILIDKTTAEVIHIDFGIAFEQGKVLPTPETVPFRLTRDIEAAMGVSGIEGTLRRCSEETMSVLRIQREIIVTLLRVLLYDPLYSWAITPAKAATYQSEHSSRSSESKDSNSPVNIETNKLAERALLRVQQKLQGIEEGVASSVSGQVERLIQQARDPANLCRLFEGWQAYL